MSFFSEHLAGRPERVRKLFELGGIAFNGATGTQVTAKCMFHRDFGTSLSIDLASGVFGCETCNTRGPDVFAFLVRCHLVPDTPSAEALARTTLEIEADGDMPATAPAETKLADAVANYRRLGIDFDASGRGINGTCPDCSKSARGLYLNHATLRWSCSACDSNGTVAQFAAARQAQEIPEPEPVEAPTPLVSGSQACPGDTIDPEGVSPAPQAVAPPPIEETAPPEYPPPLSVAEFVEELNALKPRLRAMGKAKATDEVATLLSRVSDWGMSDSPLWREANEAGRQVLRSVFPAEKKAERAAALAVDDAASRPNSWESLPTMDLVLSSMPPRGDRLATGIKALDKCSRAGFARGLVYTFIGPPGKGKTALIAQIGRRFAVEYGAIVIGFFCDEGSWQAAMMILEGSYFDREQLEDSYSEIRQRVQERTGRLKIRLPNPDDPGTFIAAVETWLADVDPAIPIVILADSAQVVRALSGDRPETPKERVDLFMLTVRRLARTINALVLVAAKANRASWASKRPADNADPLAAGLDSSEIEYCSDAIFFLTGDPSETSFLVVCKNRPGDGTKPTIPLKFNRDRATFGEIDLAVAEEEAATERRTAAAQNEKKIEAEVLEYLYSNRKNLPLSTNHVTDAIKRRAKEVRSALHRLCSYDPPSVLVRADGQKQFWSLPS